MIQADSVLSTPPTNTSVPTPEKPQDSLFYPTPVTPEEAFQAIGRLRKDARDEIDRLIGFLDKTDDYVCRELELEDGNDEPPEDEEPSLGFLDHMTDQTRITEGLGGDREDEHDGSEPEEIEPSLGSVDGLLGDQRGWAAGDDRDREFDGIDAGIGDGDGLKEQMGRDDWMSGVFS